MLFVGLRDELSLLTANLQIFVLAYYEMLGYVGIQGMLLMSIEAF